MVTRVWGLGLEVPALGLEVLALEVRPKGLWYGV